MAVVVSGDAERRVRVAEVALRCLLCALGAAAAALVATDAQTRTFFSLQKRATYKDMRALVFLVAANAAAAGYTLLLQAARWLCACTRTTGSSAVRNSSISKAKKALAWSVFSCDQALAYALLAAAAAAMQASVLSKRGLPAFQWMDVCGLYGAFCRQAGAGVASAVAAALAAVAIASLSAFNLFRLYGGGAGAATTW